MLYRPVPGFDWIDAMGGYPLFSCPRWDALPLDLAALDADVIALSLVSDPFGAPGPAVLHRWFPDMCEPFKEHFVVDLQQSPARFVDSHHRRNAHKALRHAEIEVLPNAIAAHSDWVGLYQSLCLRHGISGMRAFSPESFWWQLHVPGMVVMQARVEGEVAGMVLWIQSDDVAYYHLGAYSEAGYSHKVSFAIFWTALEYFGAKCRWLGLGAAAGLNPQADDGLTRFKRGWATGTRTAYILGRVGDHARYDQLARHFGRVDSKYFPSYRAGEFT